MAPLAVNVTLPPLQNAAGTAGVTVIVGCALTVIVLFTVVVQPLPLVTEYDIVTVPPDTPVTTPPLLMVAMAGLLVDHTPPGVVLAAVIVVPAHRLVGPVMAATVGFELTVTG